MFSFFSARPYLHLLLGLGCGIVLGEWYALPEAMLVHDQLLIWLCIVLLSLLWWYWRNEQAWQAYLPGIALVVMLGYVAASLAVRLPLAAPLRQYTGSEPLVISGRVITMPKHQRGHLRFMLQVTDAKRKVRANGDLGSCYCFVKCDASTQLYLNDRVRLYAQLEEAKPAVNFGQFDYRRYLMQHGTVVTAYAASADALTRLSKTRPWPWGALTETRSLLMRNLRQHLPPDYAELAISVVYGDKVTDLPDELEERFRRAGLTHILVASGTQVSLLILLLALAFCRVYTDFTWRSLALNLGQFTVTLSIVLAYAALTGFETSIARALIMGVLVLLGRLFHRDTDGLTSLAQSGLILLVLNPLTLNSAGFLLSFGATMGLIYAAGACFPLVAKWPRIARGTAHTLITTCGAQLFVTPILAFSFQQLSLWGLLSNLIAIPTAFMLLISGGIASLGISGIPVLGVFIARVVYGLCWLLDWEARMFTALPGSNLAVPQPPWWWIAAFYVFLFLAGEWVKNRSKITRPLRRILASGMIAIVMVLSAGVLSWLLIPRPELSALSLPGCEAYIWRPFTGQTYLIARSAGLLRQHNDETVTNALRFRGINKLAGIYWIDGPVKDPVLPDYPAPEALAAAATEPGIDMAWLVARDVCTGARFSLGGRRAWIVWNTADFGSACVRGELFEPLENLMCWLPVRRWIHRLMPTGGCWREFGVTR